MWILRMAVGSLLICFCHSVSKIYQMLCIYNDGTVIGCIIWCKGGLVLGKLLHWYISAEQVSARHAGKDGGAPQLTRFLFRLSDDPLRIKYLFLTKVNTIFSWQHSYCFPLHSPKSCHHLNGTRLIWELWFDAGATCFLARSEGVMSGWMPTAAVCFCWETCSKSSSYIL